MHRKSLSAGVTKVKEAISHPGIKRLLVITLFAIGTLFLLTSLSPAAEMKTFYLTTMDTMVELNFAAPDDVEAETIKRAVFAELERLEKLFSRTEPGSDISRINRMAGIEPVVVNAETYRLVKTAYQFAVISNGAFDPTIGPLIDSWGFLGQEYRVPEQAEIGQLLPLVDYKMIIFQESDSAIYLPEREMVIELGGLAKGFILDRAIEILKKYKVSSAFINAGGDIALLGSRPNGEPWRIGIRHPRDESRIVAVLNLSDTAVVTSGDYERFFDREGVAYHHILDPQIGRPARKLASVTILAETVVEADALSTAIFVVGPLKGLELIETLPGVEGVLVTPELEILVSSGLENNIEIQ